MKRGFLYYADSIGYLNEATTSAARLREIHPESAISILSSVGGDRTFDSIIPLLPPPNPTMVSDTQSEEKKQWKLGLLRRLENLERTPFERTLYLDSDTYVLERCDELFNLLDHFDICLAKAPLDRSPIEVRGKMCSSAEPHNCGVILFSRNERIRKLFILWREYYLSHLRRGEMGADQSAFEQALIESNARVYTLSNLWNARARYPLLLLGTVKILHVRTQDPRRIAGAINASDELRLWNPREKNCKIIKDTRG